MSEPVNFEDIVSRQVVPVFAGKRVKWAALTLDDGRELMFEFMPLTADERSAVEDHLDRDALRKEMVAILRKKSGIKTEKTEKAEKKPAKKRVQSVGAVYFVRCGDLVKIGHSTDVSSRISSLQTATPFPLELLAVVPNMTLTDERDLHVKFLKFRVKERGTEWFRLSPEIQEYITEVKARVEAIAKGGTDAT